MRIKLRPTTRPRVSSTVFLVRPSRGAKEIPPGSTDERKGNSTKKRSVSQGSGEDEDGVTEDTTGTITEAEIDTTDTTRTEEEDITEEMGSRISRTDQLDVSVMDVPVMDVEVRDGEGTQIGPRTRNMSQGG